MYNHKNYIPKKITLIIFGFIAFALVAYGVFYSVKKSQKNREKKQEQSKTLKVTFLDDKKDDPRLIDSDNDGAYDWEEELWPELDPHNPDSDGDGVLDGKYIEQKKRIRDRERRGGNEIESNLTESEKLGRSVYTALLAVEKSGGTIDEKTQEKISENVVEYISDLSLGSKMYIRDELNLVSDSKENSYTYRDKMLEIFKKYPIQTSEIDLIIKATKEPESYISEIEEAAIKYDTYVHDLAEMKVPYLIAGRHTELLNTVGQLEGALKNLGLEESDEIVSLSSLVQIDKTMNTIVETNLKLEKYFEIISDPSIFN